MDGVAKEGFLEHTIDEDCGAVTTLDSTRSEKRCVYYLDLSMKRRLTVYRESTALNNDHLEGDDIDSIEREAGSSDGSGYNSSTANRRIEEGDTTDTQPTSVSSLVHG